MNEVGRLTRLLPVACIAAAVCLFASELMTIFEFTPPGAEAICSQGAGDRHSNAQMVLAAFAIGATLVAVYGGSRPAAYSVAAVGVLALLIFLISDLRVVNATGSLNESCGAGGASFFDAEAVPQGGFWLEMVGALALAVTGIALATMTPEQLSALRPPRRSLPTEARDAPPPLDEASETPPAEPAQATATAEEPKRGLNSIRARRG
jgi:hypothetical protein